jgi:uncharacterized protein YgiB involved in biofilm formation
MSIPDSEDADMTDCYRADHTQPRRRLRSTAVRGVLVGVSAFALTACEEPVDLTFFSDVDQCTAAAAESPEFSPGDCERTFKEAMAEHAVLAPRYDELSLCEEQHGAEACAPVEVAGGVPGEAAGAEAAATQASGSVFMPLFMGYMIGNALSRSSASGYVGRPVYSDAKGGLFSSDGRRMGFAGPGSTVRATPAAVRAPALSAPAAPMTRATISARGGFGAARTASFGG